VNEVAELQAFQCPNCGASATFDPRALTKACDFCGSQFATPLPPERVEEQRQSLILPFRIDKADALVRFQRWLEKGLFKPGDLLQAFQSRGYDGMYVPFWGFTVSAFSQWYGQYSITKYRRVHKTRTTSDGKSESYEEDEPYKEWHPRQGDHSGQYIDHVTASGALSQTEADQMMPYDFAGSQPWDDSYVAGFKAELPGKPEDAAWLECVNRVNGYERDACAQLIERLDSVSSEVTKERTQLTYLPTWIFAYDYKGKQYRAVVNGQTGEANGTKPVSAGKIALAIVIAIIVIGGIVGLVLALGGKH
jgi:hypothetical protein